MGDSCNSLGQKLARGQITAWAQGCDWKGSNAVATEEVIRECVSASRQGEWLATAMNHGEWMVRCGQPGMPVTIETWYSIEIGANREGSQHTRQTKTVELPLATLKTASQPSWKIITLQCQRASDVGITGHTSPNGRKKSKCQVWTWQRQLQGSLVLILTPWYFIYGHGEQMLRAVPSSEALTPAGAGAQISEAPWPRDRSVKPIQECGMCGVESHPSAVASS